MTQLYSAAEKGVRSILFTLLCYVIPIYLIYLCSNRAAASACRTDGKLINLGGRLAIIGGLKGGPPSVEAHSLLGWTQSWTALCLQAFTELPRLFGSVVSARIFTSYGYAGIKWNSTPLWQHTNFCENYTPILSKRDKTSVRAVKYQTS